MGAASNRKPATIRYQRGDEDAVAVEVTAGPLGIRSKEIESKTGPKSASPVTGEPETFWTKLIMFVAGVMLVLSVITALYLLAHSMELPVIASAVTSVLFGLFYYGAAWILVRAWQNSVVIRQHLSK